MYIHKTNKHEQQTIKALLPLNIHTLNQSINHSAGHKQLHTIDTINL